METDCLMLYLKLIVGKNVLLLEWSWFFWVVLFVTPEVRNSKACWLPLYPSCVHKPRCFMYSWHEVLFNLCYFLSFEEVLKVFCWLRCSGCLTFSVHLWMLPMLALLLGTEVAQFCNVSSRVRPHVKTDWWADTVRFCVVKCCCSRLCSEFFYCHLITRLEMQTLRISFLVCQVAHVGLTYLLKTLNSSLSYIL